MSLKIELFDEVLKNPVMPASGTFNCGVEIHERCYDISILGALVSKSVTYELREGNKLPRVCDTEHGMLNAIGLANNGVFAFKKNELEFFKSLASNLKLIVNIAGKTVDEFPKIITELKEHEDLIYAYEINGSCPNVDTGTSYMSNNETLSKLIQWCKKTTAKPLIVKLSPESPNIISSAICAEASGAAAITLINNMKGLRVDLDTKKPMLNNIFGGYSGPAIKPLALRFVYEIYKQINIPIIGVGGITCAYDILEFMMAGASCVQIGTQNFINPYCMKNMIEELPELQDKYNIKSIKDIIGAAH